MSRNLMFPQAGIITSLNGKEARVYIPLLKIETGWIRVATNLLYEKNITLTQGELSAIDTGGGVITRPPGEAAIQFTKITTDSETFSTGTCTEIKFGTLEVGDEVAVLFFNGDLNDGVVIARMG